MTHYNSQVQGWQTPGIGLGGNLVPSGFMFPHETKSDSLGHSFLLPKTSELSHCLTGSKHLSEAASVSPRACRNPHQQKALLLLWVPCRNTWRNRLCWWQFWGSSWKGSTLHKINLQCNVSHDIHLELASTGQYTDVARTLGLPRRD